MSSDRQIAANQSNAKKSTGPTTQAGRDAARQNSRRHGLAIDISSDPAFQTDIDRLVKIVLREGITDIEQAREFAEAELDLLRIRKFRKTLFDQVRFAEAATPTDLLALNERLAKLGRYERRAYSRRKKALRAFR